MSNVTIDAVIAKQAELAQMIEMLQNPQVHRRRSRPSATQC